MSSMLWTSAPHTDYFASAAQVIPVLLLALVWESNYLQMVKSEALEHRRFWTQARIRLWSRVILPYSIATEGLAFAVLAGWVDDSGIQRGVVAAGLAGLLVTLLVRMISDVDQHTRPS
jgi:hypothetical protein